MAFPKNFKIIFHFGIIMVVRAFLVSSNQTVDRKYNACKPRSCGNGPTISYPFQIIEDGSDIDFCGYPGFEVKCENRTPIYATSLSKYIIEEISLKNQTFRLVNTDVMHSCRVPSRNFSFDRSSLDFGPNFVDLYLFYNCSNEIPEKYTRNPITCLSNSNFTLYNSFSVLNTGKEDVDCTEMPCESYVHAPVELVGGRRNQTVEGLDYLQLLENGFTLRWSGLRCGVCKKSGGHCGYSRRKPVCFCTDGVHHKDCHDGNAHWHFPVTLSLSLSIYLSQNTCDTHAMHVCQCVWRATSMCNEFLV